MVGTFELEADDDISEAGTDVAGREDKDDDVDRVIVGV